MSDSYDKTVKASNDHAAFTLRILPTGGVKVDLDRLPEIVEAEPDAWLVECTTRVKSVLTGKPGRRGRSYTFLMTNCAEGEAIEAATQRVVADHARPLSQWPEDWFIR